MADENNNKKTREHSYGWHTAREYEPYIDAVIGEYAAELDKMGFDDVKQTDYLDALKYCANLVWSEYLVKQKEKHPEPNNALVNTDVLHTILLSLHPHNMLHSSIKSAEASDIAIAENTHEALHQLDSFRSLILLQGATTEEVEAWLCHLPTTYPAWAALMGWFLTLTSKMTGERIPGVGLVPGGQINKPRQEVCCHLSAMSAIAEALAKNNHWNFLAQYSILKEMLADLRVMHANYSGKSEGKEAEETAGSNPDPNPGNNPSHNPSHNPGHSPSHNPGHNHGSSPAGGPGSSKSEGSNPGGSKTAIDSDTD